MRPDFEYFRQKRDCTPVWLDPEDNVWNVYRYIDVLTLLSDHATFSSDFRSVLQENAQDDLVEGNILLTDPPRHHELRALVSQAFSPRAIARLEGRIEAVANDLLKDTSNELEFVEQFAYPLPVTIIAQMLGVPASDRRRFKRWADALLDGTRERSENAAANLRQFHAYLQTKVASRRARLRKDLLSNLITARIGESTLNDSEIVGFATILLIAGHITTTLLLGNAVLCLDAQPDIQQVLRTDFAAIGPALEETMRFCSPVSLTRRITTRDIDICGTCIPAGQMVNVWLVSANHDERQFEHPDEFIFDRTQNAHVGFGRGIHFCLGAPLARLESSVALWSLLQRYTMLRVDPCRPPEMYSGTAFTGARKLYLQVD